MRKLVANTSRPLQSLAAQLAPDNPSSDRALHTAISSASRAINQSDAALTAHWNNICTTFVASGITTPFADWLTHAFGNRHNPLTLVRAAFAAQWRQIEESSLREEAGRRRSAANRLGLDEIWHLYLWFGASVQSQRCWRYLPRDLDISARQLFVELCRVRQQQRSGARKHYLEKAFVPREFEQACNALAARHANEQAETRDTQDQQRQAEERQRAEQQQRLEEQQRVEEQHRRETQQQLEQQQRAEEQRRREERLRAEENQRADAQQQAERDRRLEESRRQAEKQQLGHEQLRVEEVHRQAENQRLREKQQRAEDQENSQTRGLQRQLEHDDSGLFDMSSDVETEKQHQQDDSGYLSDILGDSGSVDMGTRASTRAPRGVTSAQESSTKNGDPKKSETFSESSEMVQRIRDARQRLDAVQDECAATKSQWEAVAQSEASAMLKHKNEINARVSFIMGEDAEDVAQEYGQQDSARGLGDLEKDLKVAVSKKRKALAQIESLTAKSQRLEASKETMLAQFQKAVEDHLERMDREEETIVGPDVDQ